MNNELLERVTFKDVFETKEIFSSGWADSGYSGITSTNVNIIYNLLYARYCNSTVASIDIDRFKSQVYAIMYMHGPAWQKKQAIQDYIYALQEDDIRIGSTTVLNTAQNPSTAPATDAFEALTKIDSQNASRTISSPIKAYAELRTLVEDGFTETFIDKFKKLFIVVLDTNCNLPPILRVRGNHIYTGDTVPDVGYPYWDGDLFVKTNGEIYQYNTTEWTFILSMAGELTPEILLDKIEGSDYISVDLADDKVKIELDKLDTEVTEDSDNLITSGAVFNSLADKQNKLSDTQISNINRALVSPIATSTEKRIVAVNENNEQIQVKIGQNLSLDGDTSPYTLNAQGGGSGDSKLVEVTYNSINFNDFQALLDQGKIPYCNYSGRTYLYGQTTDYAHYMFSSNISSGMTNLYRLACNKVGSSIDWSTQSVSNETTSNKETTLTSSSTTKYPSSKAVADYVAQHSGGGGWTLLWTNASPSSSFSAQTLSINLTNYGTIAIVQTNGAITFIKKDIINSGLSISSSIIELLTDESDEVDVYKRKVYNFSNNGCSFATGYKTFIETIDGVVGIRRISDNHVCTPYKIYGFN